MTHNLPLISTVASGLGLALVLGIIASRLKLPVLIGYLVAGVIIGPFTPGFVANSEIAAELAEIGVMLLMFGVGLHFSLDDLLSVKKIALPGALLQITAATLMGLGLASYWGWSFASALVFGLSLSVASTVVLLRALEAQGGLDTMNGKIAIGWLVVEDLAMVLVLVLLPPIAAALNAESGNTVAGSANLWASLGWTLLKISGFVATMLVVGKRVFPKILWLVSSLGSRELFTLCTVAAAVSIAYAAASLFGVSFALGAFFAGMVLRESEYSHRAAEESLPLREAFAVLFFVSVGMLLDPKVLIEQPLNVALVVAIIVIGKSIAAAILVMAMRYPLNTALTVSASLAQIGEFSFILASLGISLGILSKTAQSLILAGAIISIALNPLLFTLITPLQRWMKPGAPDSASVSNNNDELAQLPHATAEKLLSGQVVIVGFGRVGRRIADKMSEHGIPFVVVEYNRELVTQLRQRHILAVYGDAAEPASLIQAHIARASMLVVASPDSLAIRQMIKTARTLNPTIELVIRSHTEDETEFLQKLAGEGVYQGEAELAKTMGRHVLRRYGVTT